MKRGAAVIGYARRRAASAAFRRAKKMDFRRSGQLDERRRRVLRDEIASPEADEAGDTPPAATTAKGPVRAYSPAVLEEHQLRLTDLVPVRPLAVVCWLLVGLTGIATIEAIHVHAVTLPLAEGRALLAALDATQRGSLAAWYSASLLAAAALLALVTFGIRAHRVDDYRGHYRLWIWTAIALAWLSLDAATGLHDALGLGAVLATGQQVTAASLAEIARLLWMAAYGLAFGALAVRMAAEVWPSRISFWSLGLASVLSGCTALLSMGVLTTPAWLIEGVLESTLIQLSHLTLLASVGLYARHVYLDATGRLKVHIDADRNKKSKARNRAKLKVVKADKTEQPVAPPAAAPAAATKSAEPAKFGAPAPPAKPAASISKATVTAPAAAHLGDDDDDDNLDEDEKLSRSERRRLKKLAKREQRKAA
jgi:hypothetical protein